jgi:drug/metabolite transporter (DMT)-like permease
LWGTSDFLGGTATRRLPALIVVAVSQACALIALLPIAVALGDMTAPVGYLPWAIGAGLVGVVALRAFYHALATGTMGVVAPVAGTGVVVPILVGLARGDSLRTSQLVGIVLAGIGVVLVGGPERRRRPDRSELLSFGLALVAAAGFGTVSVFLAEGAHSSVVMTLVAMRATSVTVLVPLVAGSLARVARTGRLQLPVLGVVGVGDVSANATYAVATRSGALSVVAVLAALYPAVTVLLARQIHGERLRRVQVVGVFAVLAGVILLSLR